MSNDFFNPSGAPAQGSSLVTPPVRAEFAAIAAAFDKLPGLTGNAYKIVYVNASGSALDCVGGNGLLKLSTSGIPAVAVADTDYLAPSVIGTTVQAYSANLDEYAAVNPTAAGLALLDDADAAAQRTTLGVAIGVDVQAYDADTAKTDVAQTFTASQRGTATTDNDGSFDQSVTNNFICTPAGNVTLTFTNHTSGQSGFVLFVNTGGYTGHSVAATTKVDSSFLSTINATGTYLISYFDNGTNAYCVTSKVLA